MKEAQANEQVRAYLAEIGSKGGQAKVASKGFGALTDEQRAENGRKAALKRWGKKKAKKA